VAICTFATIAAAQDADVKSVTVSDSRDMRFCEILMVKATGVDVYNTTGVSDCPENLWSAMDVKAVAAEFGAEKVEQNGPHFWMMDLQTLEVGEEITVSGIKARFVARLDPAILNTASTGIAPYTVFTPKKTQKMTYEKGKPVYEIVDPDGHVYVLQAHEEQFPIETLDKLGDKLNLPEGWQFRTRTLTDDLVLDLGPSQTIYAVGDVFHQYWTRIP
jgi:hypothetical protein